jgi:hypothetical protein
MTRSYPRPVSGDSLKVPCVKKPVRPTEAPGRR